MKSHWFLFMMLLVCAIALLWVTSCDDDDDDDDDAVVADDDDNDSGDDDNDDSDDDDDVIDDDDDDTYSFEDDFEDYPADQPPPTPPWIVSTGYGGSVLVRDFGKQQTKMVQIEAKIIEAEAGITRDFGIDFDTGTISYSLDVEIDDGDYFSAGFVSRDVDGFVPAVMVRRDFYEFWAEGDSGDVYCGYIEPYKIIRILIIANLVNRYFSVLMDGEESECMNVPMLTAPALQALSGITAKIPSGVSGHFYLDNVEVSR